MSRSIFFAINSYMDGDLIETLDSLLSRMSKDRKFSIGIVNHDDPENGLRRSQINVLEKYFQGDHSDSTELVHFEGMDYLIESMFGGRLKMITVEYDGSDGIAWGRGLCEMMAPRDFDYYFQLSSSMRFRFNFDEEYVSSLEEHYAFPNVVMSTTLPRYFKDSTPLGQKGTGSELRPSIRVGDGWDFESNLPLSKQRLLEPPVDDLPDLHWLVNPGFLIVPAEVLSTRLAPAGKLRGGVPEGMDSDDDMEIIDHFTLKAVPKGGKQLLLNVPWAGLWNDEDDVILSARFYTHGVDLVAPKKTLAYAIVNKELELRQRASPEPEWSRSLKSIRQLVGLKDPRNGQGIEGDGDTFMEHLGTGLLGYFKSIGEFWEWCGVEGDAMAGNPMAGLQFEFVNEESEQGNLLAFLNLVNKKMEEEAQDRGNPRLM